MRVDEEIDLLADPWSVKEYLDNQTTKSRNYSSEDLLSNDLTIFATQEVDKHDTRDQRY